MSIDKKTAKEKMCGNKCIAPTVCKEIFKGECALDVMSQKGDAQEKIPGNVTGKKKSKAEYS